tara:strand:+ start:137 stop:934 length:798 start_codon:yes stop_codon:yes gene_type:complete
MLNAWVILRKSILMVTRNADQAFRLSGAIFVLAVFLSAALNVAMTGSLIVEPPLFPTFDANTAPAEMVMTEQDMRASMALVGGNLIFFIAMSWISVSWHRFVLLEEVTSHPFPSWTAGRVLRYFGIAILATVGLAFVVVIPFVMAIGFVSALGLSVLVPLVSIAMLICFYYLFFRIGLILPATALDQRMPVAQSFQDTKPLSDEIWGIAMMVVFASLIAAVLIGMIAPNNILGVLITALVQWFMVMVSASLLTTLYGHCIERRQL